MIETNDLKYLVRLIDRFEYEVMSLSNQIDYATIWDSIIDEYAELEDSSQIHKQNFTKAKFYFEWSQYTEERAMIQYLMIKTEPEYIKILRQRGYRIDTSSTIEYWKSLSQAAARVHFHTTSLELLTKEINRDVSVDDAKDKNSFDIVMAWIASNDIKVDESITVKRYVAIKKIITDKIKAHDKAIINRNGLRT